MIRSVHHLLPLSVHGAMPPALRDLVPQIDEYGFPATALLGSFLPDASAEDAADQQQRMLALVDQCLSSWIEQMTRVERLEATHIDDAWLRIRLERQQTLDRLHRLRRHLREAGHPDAGGRYDD